MTIARLVLEIRRAAELPQQLPRPKAMAQAAWEVLLHAAPGEELDHARRILAGLLGVEKGATLDAKMLDKLTPEVILRLDALIDDLIQFGGRDDAAVKALRAAVIRRVS